MVRRAICCCGESHIEVWGDPTLNGICHCDNCKKRTGTAFGWSAYFADGNVLAKNGVFSRRDLDGPDKQERYFCASCGTTLYWKSGFMPNQTGVAGGCFIDPPLPEPSVQVHNHTKHPWVTLPETWSKNL